MKGVLVVLFFVRILFSFASPVSGQCPNDSCSIDAAVVWSDMTNIRYSFYGHDPAIPKPVTQTLNWYFWVPGQQATGTLAAGVEPYAAFSRATGNPATIWISGNSIQYSSWTGVGWSPSETVFQAGPADLLRNPVIAIDVNQVVLAAWVHITIDPVTFQPTVYFKSSTRNPSGSWSAPQTIYQYPGPLLNPHTLFPWVQTMLDISFTPQILNQVTKHEAVIVFQAPDQSGTFPNYRTFYSVWGGSSWGTTSVIPGSGGSGNQINFPNFLDVAISTDKEGISTAVWHEFSVDTSNPTAVILYSVKSSTRNSSAGTGFTQAVTVSPSSCFPSIAKAQNEKGLALYSKDCLVDITDPNNQIPFPIPSPLDSIHLKEEIKGSWNPGSVILYSNTVQPLNYWPADAVLHHGRTLTVWVNLPQNTLFAKVINTTNPSQTFSFGPLSSVLVTIPRVAAHTGSPQVPHAEWTHMTYLAGDNDASPVILNDKTEMMQGGGSSNLVNVVTLSDGVGNSDSFRSYLSTNEVIRWSGELNTGHPLTFSDFLAWSLESYPSNRTILDIGGLGAGWQGIATDKFSNFDWLTLPELRQALLDVNKKLDLAQLSTCRTANLETVYQVEGFSRYFIGSEENFMGSGINYAPHIQAWTANPQISTQALGNTILNRYQIAAQGQNQNDYTISLIDMNLISGLVNNLNTLALQLSLNFLPNHETIRQAWIEAERMRGHPSYADLSDLSDEFDLNVNNAQIQAAAQNVMAGILSAVLNSWTGVNHPFANGLNIYAEANRGVANKLSPQYNALRLSQDTLWNDVMNVEISAPFQILDQQPYVTNQAERCGSPLTVRGTIEDGLGNFLQKARVRLYRGNDITMHATSPDGEFSFAYENLKPGAGQPGNKIRIELDHDITDLGVNKQFLEVYNWEGYAASPLPVFFETNNFDFPLANDLMTLELHTDPTWVASTNTPDVFRLDDLAHIYYETYRAADFADKELLQMNHEMPVEVFTFRPGGTGVYYCPLHTPPWDGCDFTVHDSKISIDWMNSGFADADAPDNREWHEFGHHVMTDSLIGGNNVMPTDPLALGFGTLDDNRNGADNEIALPILNPPIPPGIAGLYNEDPGAVAPLSSGNHLGYFNPSTADSWTEAFAEFFSMAVADYYGDPLPERYRVEGAELSLEDYWHPWFWGPFEELAIAALLWDLYDGNADGYDMTMHPSLPLRWTFATHLDDNIDLTLPQLWNLINTPAVVNVRALYLALDPAINQDLDGDGLDDLNESFILHGLFADSLPFQDYNGEVVSFTGYNRNFPPAGVLMNAIPNDAFLFDLPPPGFSPLDFNFVPERVKRGPNSMRQDLPPFPGSFIAARVLNFTSGELLNESDFFVQIQYDPPFQDRSMNYTMQTQNLSENLFVTLPLLQATAIIEARKAGYVNSNPLIINSSFYWSALLNLTSSLVNPTEYFMNYNFLLYPENFTANATLSIQGSPVIGQTTNLSLSSPSQPNSLYILALALGTNPGIPLGDGRVVNLTLDPLFLLSILDPSAVFLTNSQGILSSNGNGLVQFSIPNVPALAGLTVYAGFVTVNPSLPGAQAVTSISPPLAITIQSPPFPSVQQVILNSTFGTNSTNENLTAYLLNPQNSLTEITDWRVNGQGFASLNMPFDTQTQTNAKDYSPNNLTGTVNGSLWTSNGKVGGTYNFDGINDFIEIPDYMALNLTNNLTLEAWIFWNGEANATDNLQNIITSGYFRRALRVTEPDHFAGGNKILSFFNIGGNDIDLYSTTQITPNNWYHLATTYNGNELKIYINGVLDASIPASGQIHASEISTFIGTEETEYFFSGAIDEVKIYSRPLSQEQIYENYLAGLQGKHPLKISSEETQTGQTWQVAVTPNDEVQDGATVSSNTLTIL